MAERRASGTPPALTLGHKLDVLPALKLPNTRCLSYRNTYHHTRITEPSRPLHALIHPRPPRAPIHTPTSPPPCRSSRSLPRPHYAG